MSTVAIVTCAGVDVDPDSPILLDALASAGVEARLTVWDDPSVDWESFDLVVIRSTWDYATRLGEFRAWVDARGSLCNDAAAVGFSIDKHYLAELAAAGVSVVPTTFVDVGESPEFPSGDFVVKPAVGAGSIDAERYGPEEHDLAYAHVATLHAHGRDALVQPYVDSVDTEGETALIFLDGVFSHAMTKAAMLNVDTLDRNKLFRMEQMSVARVDESAVAVGTAVLAAAGCSDLLYARVDLVRVDGAWSVMELELVEPSLFFWMVPEAANRLARAIAARLERGRPR